MQKKNKIKKNILILILILIIILILSKILFYSDKNIINNSKNEYLCKEDLKGKEINEEEEYSEKEFLEEESYIDLQQKMDFIKKKEYIMGKSNNKNEITNIDEIYRAYFKSINKYDNFLIKIFEEEYKNYKKIVFQNNKKIKKIKIKISVISNDIKTLKEKMNKMEYQICEKEKSLIDLITKFKKNKISSFKNKEIKNFEKEIDEIKCQKNEIFAKYIEKKIENDELLKNQKNLEEKKYLIISEKNKIRLKLKLITELNKTKMLKFKKMLNKTYKTKLYF